MKVGIKSINAKSANGLLKNSCLLWEHVSQNSKQMMRILKSDGHENFRENFSFLFISRPRKGEQTDMSRDDGNGNGNGNGWVDGRKSKVIDEPQPRTFT